jgi:hypothetical protein
MADRPTKPRTPKPPPPPKPWVRAEAGRHRSSDDRFTLESDGGGRWFVTDAETLDELGLARTTGPFATLDAAKAGAEAARANPTEASPLAARIAEAATRPKPAKEPASSGAATAKERAARSAPTATPDQGAKRASKPAPEASDAPSAERPAAPPKQPRPTWLDELDAGDRDRATRARRLIAALEREGISGAEALVRRDLLGGTPAVAMRLLARDVLAALARLKDPSALQVAEAVAGVLATSPRRGGLPGWELVERDGPAGERRPLRLSEDDLRAVAENVADE